MKDMKKILLALIVIGTGFVGCKYDDSYLNPNLPKNTAYFASMTEYNRTVVVGEGLRFKIGAAIGGVLKNEEDRTVDFKINTTYYKRTPADTRVLLPTSYYNSSELGSPIRAIIPKGEYLGYFTVKLDSAKFLADPLSMYTDPKNNTVGYTLPVKIVGTSCDSINAIKDSIKVSVRYIAGVDGYYLYQSTIKKEIGGAVIESKTITDNAVGEADVVTWRLLTKGPFTVMATSPANSKLKSDNAGTKSLSFNMTVDQNKVVSVSPVAVPTMPVVTLEGVNTYDSKTRDFSLNFNYKKTVVAPAVNDTVYHVSVKLIFRNRWLDNVNQTREYLSYFNK